MKRLLCLALVVCAFVVGPPASAQNAALLPVPKMQFFDNNGLPLAGGQIYFCVAGSTCPGTPLATYTDSTAGTQNPNPVVLDAAGRASIWIGSSAYKVVAEDANSNVLWTQDNVSSTALATAGSITGSNGAALINYTAAGSGVARTVAAKFGDVVSVKDYGAAGNGTTDDTASIQKALTYACSVGAAVYAPRGQYLLSSTLTGCSNLVFYGDGMGATTLNQASAVDAIAWTDASRFTLRDMTISSGGNGLHVIAKTADPVYPVFTRVEISAFGSASTGMLFDVQGSVVIFFPILRDCVVNGGSAAPSVGTRTGINFISTNAGAGYVTVNPQILGGRVVNVQTGIIITNAVQQVVGSQTEFDGITTNSTGTGTGIGIHFESGSYLDLFSDLRFEANPAIDKYFVFDSGANGNVVRGVFAPATANTVITDAGVNNGWYGTDGSGGAGTGTNMNKLPYPITWTGTQTFQNAAVFSNGFSWTNGISGPASTDSAFTIGSPPNASSRGGINAGVLLAAPNSAWGFPAGFVGDASQRGLWLMSQNFSQPSSTGTAVEFFDDGHVLALSSGTSGTVDVNQLQIDSWNGSSGLSSAVPIKGYLSATATWSPGSIGAGSYASTSLAVTGCTSTDLAYASFSSIGSTPVVISATPGSGTVYVTAYNASGSAWNPASGTVRASCLKH